MVALFGHLSSITSLALHLQPMRAFLGKLYFTHAVFLGTRSMALTCPIPYSFHGSLLHTLTMQGLPVGTLVIQHIAQPHQHFSGSPVKVSTTHDYKTSTTLMTQVWLPVVVIAGSPSAQQQWPRRPCTAEQGKTCPSVVLVNKGNPRCYADVGVISY